MASSSDRLVWIDCEMTGLDLEVDELVEIAVVITDYDLNPVDAGLQHRHQARRQRAREHGRLRARRCTPTSGLIEEIPNGVSVADAEYQVLEYIQQARPRRAARRRSPATPSAPTARSSRSTCRASTAPALPQRRRLVDQGARASAGSRARTSTPPPKNGGHRALADILESIRELALLPSRGLRRRARPDRASELQAVVGLRRGRVRLQGVVVSSSCQIAPAVDTWWV